MNKTALRLIVAVLTLAACGAFAQRTQGLAHKPKPAVGAEDASLVTRNEYRTVVVKLRSIVHAVLRVDLSGAGQLPSKGEEAVRREEMIGEFSKLADLCRGAFKITPPPVKFRASALRLSDARAKAQAERLIALGFVAKVGPLVTGPKDGLNPEQFGDSVGLFISRLADLTHTPSAKWSPYLQKG